MGPVLFKPDEIPAYRWPVERALAALDAGARGGLSQGEARARLATYGKNELAADARLIEATALQTAEAALTGESLPVAKDPWPISEAVGLGERRNMLFSGTAATYGRAKAVVVATGMQTEVGRISGLLKAAPSEATPLEKALARVGKRLGLTVIAIAAVMIATVLLVQGVRGVSGLF